MSKLWQDPKTAPLDFKASFRRFWKLLQFLFSQTLNIVSSKFCQVIVSFGSLYLKVACKFCSRLRSVEYAGHCRNEIRFSLKYKVTQLASCSGNLSCWNDSPKMSDRLWEEKLFMYFSANGVQTDSSIASVLYPPFVGKPKILVQLATVQKRRL